MAPNINKLIKKLLENKNADIRRESASSLGKLGDPRALESLIQALKDDHTLVREYAAEALGKIGDPRALVPLLQTLKDEDKYVRYQAAEALDNIGWNPRNNTEKAYFLYAKREWDKLTHLGEEGVKILSQALKNKDKNVRIYAAEALGKIGNPIAVDPLIEALKDKEWVVRILGVSGLRDIGDVRALEPLSQALKDIEALVRKEAAEALEKLGWKPKMPRIVLSGPGSEDFRSISNNLLSQDSFKRREAIKALGLIGSEEAKLRLLTHLKGKGTKEVDRELTALTLARNFGNDILDVFTEILLKNINQFEFRDKSKTVPYFINLKNAAAKGVEIIGDKTSLEPLLLTYTQIKHIAEPYTRNISKSISILVNQIEKDLPTSIKSDTNFQYRIDNFLLTRIKKVLESVAKIWLKLKES